jgi:hypothetical protein
MPTTCAVSTSTNESSSAELETGMASAFRPSWLTTFTSS